MKDIRRERRAIVTVINVGKVKQSNKTRNVYRGCSKLSNQGIKAEIGMNLIHLKNRRMHISRT